MQGYVYLRVAPGLVQQTLASLEGQPGIRRAVAVTGTWDIIVALSEHDDIHAIGQTVLQGIQALDGVKRTVTAPVAPLDKTEGWAAASPRPRPFPMHRIDPFCYVHVSLVAGTVVETILALQEIGAVSAVAPLIGSWDAIVELDVDALDDAVAVVVDQIGQLEGVASTWTAMAVASTADTEPLEPTV